MKIQLISERELTFLRDDWDRLAIDLITSDKFEWVYTWWQHFKSNKNLKVIIAEDNNRIVGIAPLYLRQMGLLNKVKIKKLCFLGEGISSYIDFLIEQNEDREKIFKNLIDYTIHNIDFDSLELRNINSGYPNFDLWQKYLNLLNLKQVFPIRSYRINLSPYSSYNSYYDSLNKRLKQDLRLCENRIIKNKGCIEYIFKKNINKNDIAEIANLNIDRQKFLTKKGISGRFSYFMDKDKYSFIEDHFCYGESGSKMLAYLKYNGKVVAYALLLINGETLSYWNAGFDSLYSAYSPSKLLINQLVKFCFENDYKYFDFMRGEEPYKLQWASEYLNNFHIIYKKTMKAKLAYLYKDFAPKFLLPDSMKLTNVETALREGTNDI